MASVVNNAMRTGGKPGPLKLGGDQLVDYSEAASPMEPA